MKVTLQIDGKKRTFSNVENISIEKENAKIGKKGPGPFFPIFAFIHKFK